MRHRFLLRVLICAIVAAQASAAGAQVIFADQGGNWTEALRADFYSRDQGSKMIPLAWLRALQQQNGQPFLADSLGRYGYLRNPANDNTTKLPVGFTASGPTGSRVVGMTCAACHTRQIIVEGKTYRIDGGPAIVDFQSFLADLDTAVGRVLASDAAFKSFAAAALGTTTPDAEDVSDLRKEVEAWFERYHTLITRALPTSSWGPARLDAVSMIFNRLTGLDIGPPPSYLIPDNIRRADAPVRYPFLWNAPIQDKTQWPGFADNGNDILGLARNLGEVLGVFAAFAPISDGFFVDFISNNSANFDGLARLEDLIKRIGPPKWPWPEKLGPALVAQGEAIYNRATDQGGCVECHRIKDGKPRLFAGKTWDTPIQNVGTDTREYDVLARTVDTGVLRGAFIPTLTSPLQGRDLAVNVLATSVIGSIAEHVVSLKGVFPIVARTLAPIHGAIIPPQLVKLPPSLRDLQGMFKEPPENGAYESRVMEGIWAAAPYLHNGSVPTLAELLKPPAERVPAFKIGSNYDIDNVGLAVEQTQFGSYTLTTTDCSDRNSGNSRCGHDFGTRLSAPEKKALLEYLKTL